MHSRSRVLEAKPAALRAPGQGWPLYRRQHPSWAGPTWSPLLGSPSGRLLGWGRGASEEVVPGRAGVIPPARPSHPALGLGPQIWGEIQSGTRVSACVCVCVCVCGLCLCVTVSVCARVWWGSEVI